MKNIESSHQQDIKQINKSPVERTNSAENPSHSEIQRARNSKPQRNTKSSENPSHSEIQKVRKIQATAKYK
jgi:hypothetical protein